MVRICSRSANDSLDNLPVPAMAAWVGRGFFGLAGDGTDDGGGAVAVSDVILQDKYGTDAPLFTAHNGA